MPTTCFTRSTHEPSLDLSLVPQNPPTTCPPPPACRRHAGCLLVRLPATTPPSLSSFPPADLPAPNFQWSAKQIDVLFAITRYKAELKLQAATTKTHHEEEESLARIAAIRAPISIAISAASTRTVGEDEETSIDEISFIILSVAGRYLGLANAKIAQIYNNCFNKTPISFVTLNIVRIRIEIRISYLSIVKGTSRKLLTSFVILETQSTFGQTPFSITLW